MSLDDPSVLDDGLGKLFGILQELSDEEVLEGIGFLLGIVTPWMETMREGGERDAAQSEAERRNWAVMLPKAGKAVLALTLIGFRSLASSLGKTPPAEHGRTLGVLLNRSVALINDLHARNPQAVSGFMTGLFKTVDRKELRRTADILAEAFLDQRPKLGKWVGATLARRARRIVFRRKQEGT